MKKLFASVFCIICFSFLLNTGITAFARTDFLPAWPLRSGFNISALDAYQSGSAHRGIDIGHGDQPTQKVYAIAKGVVTETGNKCSHKNQYPHSSVSCSANSLGNFVTIKHDINGKIFYSQYAHLTKDSITVEVGDSVTPNTAIGRMGSSGNSTGPHLHLAIWEKGYDSDRARTFDFYKDNADLMKTIRIRKKLAEVSKIYGTWIKNNGTLKNDGLYYFDSSKSTTTTKPATTTHTCTSYQTKNGKPGVCKVCGKAYKYTLQKLSAQVYELKDNYKNSKIGIYKEPYEDAASYSYKVTSKITVVGYVTNAYKSKWYAINYYDSSTKKTVTAYVYAKDFDKKYQKQSTSSSSSKNTSSSKPATPAQPTASKPSIDVTSYPTSINQGSSYGLRGTVYANGAKTTVTTEVINSSGKVVLSATDTVSANSTGDIRYMNANNKITFNKLGAGTYTLKFTAKNSAGSKTWSNNFTVKGKSSSTSSSAAKAKSTLNVNLTSYPSNINKGKSFGLRGSVTSNYNITTVIGTIYDSKGNVVQRTTDYPNSTSMDIRYANVNNNLIFNKLAKGYYVLQVTATDTSGSQKVWSSSFNVV